MSVVFKQDAKASAVQLGKALQDPVKGMTALARVGITFTAQQQKQIKALVKSGDLLGAQKIILGEVKKQTEGAAEASTTYAEKATVAWGNIKEVVGGFLNEQLEPVSKWFVDTGLPAVKDFFDKISKDKALKDAITNLKDALTTLTGDEDFKASLDSIAASLPGIVNGLANIVTKYGEISTAIDKFENKSFGEGDKVGGPVGRLIKDFGAGGTIEVALVHFRRVGPAKVKDAWADIKTTFTKDGNFTNSLTGGFVKQQVERFTSLKDRAKARASEMWTSVKDTFFKRTGEVRDKVSGWRTSVAGFFTSLGTSIKTRSSEMWTSVKGTFFKRADEVRTKVGGWRDSLVTITKDLSTKIRTAVSDMLSRVTTSFKNGVTSIGNAWDKVKGKAKEPIKFIVNTVLDDGILAAFRSISKLVGYKAGTDFHVSLPKGFKTGTSQVLPGYTPGRDVHRFYSATGGVLDLSGGEGIARPEIVKALGRKRWDAANAAAARGEIGDSLQYLGGFASGGIAAAMDMARKRFHISSIGTYPGHHPSQALARDFMTSSKSQGDALASALWANRQAINLWYLIWWRRIISMTRPGAGWQPYTRSNPHTDHVHASFYPAALRGIVGALSKVGGVITNAIDTGKYFTKITDALAKMKDIEKTGFGKAVAGIPRTVVGAVKDKITELVSKFASVSSGFASVAGGSNRAIGHKMMLQRWPESEWAPLERLWTRESNWNHRAKNPSSGAYGIPQSLPASKMRSAGADYLTNPATQIKWGLGYIAGRYGSPGRAWSAWSARSPHWYARGTQSASPGLAIVGEREPEIVHFRGGESVTPLSKAGPGGVVVYGGVHGYSAAEVAEEIDKRRRRQQALRPVFAVA